MFAVRAVAATRAAILERVHKLAGQFCPIYKRMEHRSLTENQELFQGPVVKFTNIKESDVDDDVANPLRSIDEAQGFKGDTGVVLTEDTDPPQAKEDEKSEEHSADDEFELDGEWRDDSYYRSLLGGTNLGGI